MPEFVSQKYEIAPLSSLQKHPRNANQGDFGAIKQSVDANGFYGAIIAQRGTGYILAGNHRYDVLRSEGAEQAPVIWVDVGEVEAARILLADNRTTRLGDDDPAKLAALLKDIQAESGTLEGTGYDGDALDAILRDLGELPGAAAPELNTNPQMGGLEYRVIVMCSGEAQQAELIERFEAEGLKCKALIS